MQGEHRSRYETAVRGNHDLELNCNLNQGITQPLRPIIAQCDTFGKALVRYFKLRFKVSTEKEATSPSPVLIGWPSGGPNAVP